MRLEEGGFEGVLDDVAVQVPWKLKTQEMKNRRRGVHNRDLPGRRMTSYAGTGHDEHALSAVASVHSAALGAGSFFGFDRANRPASLSRGPHRKDRV